MVTVPLAVEETEAEGVDIVPLERDTVSDGQLSAVVS